MKYLSVREAQELDRRAQQEFHIPAILLMEHAAQAVAAEALSLGKRFVVVVGPGNNGGDGLAAARLLHLQGKRVDLLTLRPLDPENVQTRMVRALGVPQTRDLRAPVIIDALFGAGLDRDVDGPAAALIERINDSGRIVLAVDIPSGLDGDSGRPRGVAVKATVTVTMGFPKIGFRRPGAKQYVGRLVVADIGYPR